MLVSWRVKKRFSIINYHPFWGTPIFGNIIFFPQNQQSESQLKIGDFYEVSQFITDQPGPTWSTDLNNQKLVGGFNPCEKY